MSEVRVGYVSSIDYENGLCEIHYPDRDDTVTEMVPFLSNQEYRTPEVEDMVLVLHPGDSRKMRWWWARFGTRKSNRRRARRASTARSSPTRMDKHTESLMQTQKN